MPAPTTTTTTGASTTSRPQPVRIVLALDGTWENQAAVSSAWKFGSPTSRPQSSDWYTNPALLALSIPPLSRPDSNGKQWRQVCFYQSGIGSGQVSLLGRLVSGATGIGLKEKVQEAYAFLVENYQEGDEIAIFGFSRGAYTARCISGFIAWAGILQKCASKPLVDGRAINESIYFNDIFDAYSKRKPDDPASIRQAAEVLHNLVGRWPSTGSDAVSTADQLAQQQKVNGKGSTDTAMTIKAELIAEDGAPKTDDVTVPPPVKVLGVWDTVGALGVPGFFPESTLFEFFDPGLSANVAHAFQALALGEDRRDFMPTLWYKPWPSQETARQKGQVLKQVWFSGAHSNVGGSNAYHGLSDITLAWMVAQLMDTPSPDGPLIDVDIDVLRTLQDCRLAWAKELPKPSRAAVEWQETRQVRAKPDDDDSQDKDWKDNVYTGITNESIHYSVVVGGLYDKDTAPQFAELRASHPQLLDAMFAAASNVDSLSKTEKLLMWNQPDPAGAWSKPPVKNAIARALLKVLAASSTAIVRAVSDVVNFHIIPAR